ILITPLYHSERFNGIQFSDRTVRLIEADPSGAALVDLNRLILEEIYPNEIKKRRPKLFPDYAVHFHQRMAAMIQRKAAVARNMHAGVYVGKKPLSALFEDPEELMNSLIAAGYVDRNHPRDSKFLDFLRFD